MILETKINLKNKTKEELIMLIEEGLVIINKQQSELEKKDKIIDEMSNFINEMSNELVAETGINNLEFCKMKKCIDDGNLECADCIKEYFTKKCEEK